MGRDNARVTGVAAAEPDAAAVMRTFGLGDRVLSMHPLKGAWSNRVYRLVTDRGEFAVKQLLNPWQDPRWAEWLDESWRFELAAYDAGTDMPEPIPNPKNGSWLGHVPARGSRAANVAPTNATRPGEMGSRSGQGDRGLDGTGLVTVRVHRWVNGAAPGNGPVTMRIARWAGRTLATLHGLGHEPGDKSLFPQFDTVTADHWPELTALVARHNVAWRTRIAIVTDTIAAMARLARDAQNTAEPEVMSHGDLRQKNLILTADGPVLCDWDVAAPVVPVRDLASVALTLGSWKRFDVGRAVVAAYRDAGGDARTARPEDLGPSLMVNLDWIAFNVERALGLHGATPRDVALGNQLVPGLLARLPRQLEASLRVAELFAPR
ncbi:MAG TPA: aminoglycoside phosphotransferase family protein [Kribbellaceae bacterium]